MLDSHSDDERMNTMRWKIRWKKSSIEIDGRGKEIFYRRIIKNHQDTDVPVCPDSVMYGNPIGFLQEVCYVRDWELPKYELSMNTQGGNGRYSATYSIRRHTKNTQLTFIIYNIYCTLNVMPM